jgi:hypothetical protein
LLRVWPKESNIEDLAKEELEEGEVWEKGEAYMIQLVYPTSMLNRLKVWTFKEQWAEEKVIAIQFHARIMNAY